MRTNKSSIWVDVTDMLAWRGHFTGIQRVVNEYASRMSSDGAALCAYDAVDDRYFELSMEYLRQLQAVTGDGPQTVSWKRRLKSTMKNQYERLPGAVRLATQPFVDSANHTGRYILSKTVFKNRKQTSPYASFAGASFAKEDKVVVLGAGWNEARALQKLIELKKTHHFKIIHHLNDVLPIFQPHLFHESLPVIFRPYVDEIIRYCDGVTVISKATKRDLEAYYQLQGVEGPPISIVRLGDDPAVAQPIKPDMVDGGESFILAFGTFEVRKNYHLLYQVVKLAELEGRELPKFVIVGRKGWLTNDLAHILEHDPWAQQRILWISDASDEEISWLLQNSMFTVFPSFAEGWGLPIVESLQAGKFCLSSGVSSMLEIGDGLIDYFLPYDPRECLEKIAYYLHDERYKQANEKAKKSYKIYTWDESYATLRTAISQF